MDWNDAVKQYSAIVWKTIHRLAPESSDAADCFQATFLSAWQISQKQPIRNWPALLRHLATSRALERCRELARRRARHADLPIEGVIDPRSNDPAANVATSELEDVLRAALVEIDPREAEVFCLACLDELTYREIGSQLGLTVNHVGVLLNRARARLRSRLRSYAPTPVTNAKENAE